MFYILMGVIGIVAIVLAEKFMDRYSNLKEFIVGSGIVSVIAGAIVSFIMMLVGLSTYPILIADKEEIIVLKANVDNIKNARYESQQKNQHNNKFIDGSIENTNQSTILSNYIIGLTRKTASYNSDLVKNKIYESGTIYFWFTYGAFISKDVHKLEKF